jgi:hypothetical protein
MIIAQISPFSLESCIDKTRYAWVWVGFETHVQRKHTPGQCSKYRASLYFVLEDNFDPRTLNICDSQRYSIVTRVTFVLLSNVVNT